MTSDTVIFQELKLETIECYSCGVIFAIPNNLRRRLLDKGDIFYCPNGHSQCYTKSTETRLAEAKRQLKQKQKTLEWAEQSARRAREDAEHQQRRANGYKGQLTLTKKRISAGTCPCCRRSFGNLYDHMRKQHPSYTHDEEVQPQ